MADEIKAKKVAKVKKEETKIEEKKEEKIESKKDEKKEKPELTREYIIPLRKSMLKVPRYKRARKAIKTIRIFLAKHMKVEDRDVHKVRINKYLNNEIWYRGIKNPPVRIKVKAEKIQGIVYVELADIPDKVKWLMEKDKKMQKVDTKKLKEIAKQEAEEKKEQEKPVETKEEKREEKEKEQSVVESGLKEQKLEARQAKHTEKVKQPKQQQIHRMAMQR